jgi:hypothetical protein
MRDGFAAARAGDREPRPYAWLRLLALLFACNLWALAVVARAQGAERLADAVVSVGMTVSDADRAADFYARVLGFEKVSDLEVMGPEVEALTGVFGARLRVVALGLGRERIELTEFVTPRGRSPPTRAATTSGSSTWRSWCATRRPASRSTATSWASRSPARARTGARSRST